MWRPTLCPFHEERHPSAAYTEDGGFICHACGVKGKLYNLLREVLGLDADSANARYEEITGTSYDDIPQRSGEGWGVSIITRDYERGRELFPAWFRN